LLITQHSFIQVKTLILINLATTEIVEWYHYNLKADPKESFRIEGESK